MERETIPIHDYHRHPWKRPLAETLLKRDGDKCQGCGAAGVMLEIAHTPPFRVQDGWRIEICNLKCHSCNGRESRMKPVFQGDARARDVGNESETSADVRSVVDGDLRPAEMERGDVLEPLWWTWVRGRVLYGPPLRVSEAIYGGAMRFTDYGKKRRLSPVSTRRWLKKLISEEGPLTTNEVDGVAFLVYRGFPELDVKEQTKI